MDFDNSSSLYGVEYYALRGFMREAEIHLKQDGIKEALFEIRFESPITPEVVIGRLTDAEGWAGFNAVRMVTADIPPQLRDIDLNMRYAPSYELVRSETNELIRIGPKSLSYHRLAPYPGWTTHFPAVRDVVETLFSKIQTITPTRLGFRYVNALNGPDHLIEVASNLALKIAIGDGEGFEPDSFALNYKRQNELGHVEQVQVATPDYVQGQSGPSDFSVLVDIDIFTPDAYSVVGQEDVLAWIETAHDLLKQNFFKLLPNSTIEQLRVT